jgi:signal transduction histidine kinase
LVVVVNRRDRPRRTFSLRTHLVLLIIGTTVPALALAAFLARRVVADYRDTIQRQLLETARSQAALVDAELGGTIRALEGLAQSDRLADGDVDGFYVQAGRMLATQSRWGAVSLSTPEGHQIVNTERPLDATLPYVTDINTIQRISTTKIPAIGNLRVGRVSGQLGFPVRVPVVRDGKVVYILSAWITSASFASVFDGQATLTNEWARGIVDANGVLVARSREAERYVGQKGTASAMRRYAEADEGVYRDVSLDGTPVYGAFSRAPVSHWIAGVAVPASVVAAPFRQSLAAVSALALMLIGIGSAGAYLVSRRISSDIRRTTNEADAIASGRGPSAATARVTEVQRVLDALAQSAALLQTRERERDEHVARADAARDEAEAADRAKDQFLAMLGHELRNPLAPALTAIELMKLKGGAPTTRERDVIERQIRHMARLVDDLLDVSRLRRGAIGLQRERIDVGDAVARAVEMTTPVFTERRHALEVSVEPGLFVDGDRVRLAQIISNLLTNAAKYTEPGGRATLRVWAEGGEVVIECRDTGIGMTPELVPRVFDLFVQGERGLDRREGGLGLGLALARTLVELHGGRITAASDGARCGSTFTVRLPAAAPPARIPADVIARAAAGTVVPLGRVLIVDDNVDALEMLADALKTAGAEVLTAPTAAEALSIAERARPQAAVLDIGLPEMNGFDLARALRQQAAGAPLRLLAVTGYGQAQDMAAARAAGFDAFFVKPVEVKSLVAALTTETVSR